MDDDQVTSTSMQRVIMLALTASVCGTAIASGPACAQPMQMAPGYGAPGQAMPVSTPYRQGDLGGGFVEFLFRGPQPRGPRYQDGGMPVQEPPVMQPHVLGQPDMRMPPPPAPMYARNDPAQMVGPGYAAEPAQPAVDPRYMKQVVNYMGKEPAGTIIIDTPQRFLFLVQGNGRAIRYGIGVGKPGFTWAGVKQISRKAEWPDWRPPEEMLKRRPDLPPFMAGGPNNPLGARAMYLGSSLYRIHGSNEPWTIGHAVSSGCIRMRNEDVTDLYERVKVGTRVVVI
jgi:lipoprotein-anchoring transpeptidase ErfK/SrfK